MTDEEHEFLMDTAEKAAVAKGIRHRKGYRSRKVTLPFESQKGAERKAYMGETTVSSNLQELTWEQFKAMDKDNRIKTLKRMICTYGNSYYRLQSILGGPQNSLEAFTRFANIRTELDRYWESLPKQQQEAATKRGKLLAEQRREQRKNTDASQKPAQADLPPEAEQTPSAPLYWAETTIRRNGVAGKELRAQIAGLLQSVTDDGIYDVKIMVGAKEA